jgi:hypothetical protein
MRSILPQRWQKIDGKRQSCHWWQWNTDSSISAMEPALIVWLLLTLVFVGYLIHLVHVVRDDDHGGSYTHRPAPPSHHQDSTGWPWRTA